MSASYPGEIALGCGIAAGSNELGFFDALRRLFRRRHFQRVSAFHPKARERYVHFSCTLLGSFSGVLIIHSCCKCQLKNSNCFSSSIAVVNCIRKTPNRILKEIYCGLTGFDAPLNARADLEKQNRFLCFSGAA